METLSKLWSWFKNQAIYQVGRHALDMAMIMVLGGAASFIPGITTWPALFIALGVSLPLQLYVFHRKQTALEDRLLKDYNNEISARVGVPEPELTRGHLRQVTDGDQERGIAPNPILKEVLDREASRQLLRRFAVGAAAAVSVAVFSLFAGTPAVEGVVQWIGNGVGSILNAIGLGALAPHIQVIPGMSEEALKAVKQSQEIFTAMLFSGTFMTPVSMTLQSVGDWVLGNYRKTAHDLIGHIEWDLARNRIITEEQVFSVFVAADGGLNAMIEAIYHKPYYTLGAEQQQEALRVYGREFQDPLRTPRTISDLTLDLNNRQIEADELAFAVVGQRSGVARLLEPQPRGPEKSRLATLAEEVATELKQRNGMTVEKEIKQALHEVENTASEAANDNVPGFAARFTPREPVRHERRKPDQSFADREKAREMERIVREKELTP